MFWRRSLVWYLKFSECSMFDGPILDRLAPSVNGLLSLGSGHVNNPAVSTCN